MSVIRIIPTERQEVTKIVCPDCKETLKNVGLLRGSKIDGLAFRCRKCGAFKKVKTE